jgi:hypothetical protein
MKELGESKEKQGGIKIDTTSEKSKEGENRETHEGELL